MREGEQTGEYIWLRQSVTFTASGQSRTLEIAIPVRPGATASEVAALLAQAEAGMAQLSHTLDARVAAALSPQPAISAAAEPATLPQRPASPISAPTGDQEEQEAILPAAPAIHEPAASRPASAEPTRPMPVQPPTAPAPARPATPAASQPRPAPARPSSPSSVPPAAPSVAPSVAPSAAPSASSAAAPARDRASEAPTAPAPGASGPELSRPEFLAAVAQLGLKPKEAMDKLGVRSLEGLNLREALESLRRQMLRSSATPAAPTVSAPPSAEPPRTPPARAETTRAATTAAVPASVPSRAPAYFDEEDDADFTFTVDEEGALDAGDVVAGEPPESPYGSEPDDYDLDDVPDFGPPSGRASAPSTSSRAPARTAPVRAAPSHPSAAPSSLSAPASAVEATAARGAANARALDLIKQMRSASAGGASSAQQRTAYRNIIVAELGEASARALVQRLWRVTPDRLGPDQYDALISWGKQDTFADDAQLVLAALEAERQAEREQASGGTSANGAATPATPAASPSTPHPRPGTTGTTTGTTRGDH